MPRSVQAFRQNAVVTNSPANTSQGNSSSAVDQGASTFQQPPTLDVCAPATGGTRNPFISGLNTMGGATGNSTGVAGQTGQIMSGFQIFSDTMCGQALGGSTASEVVAAWRHIREQSGNPRELYRAVRRLRDSAGAGTTPQSVIAGTEAVTGIVNANPAAQDAIATGQAAAGISGNQIIDSINGAQAHANTAHQTLTGQTTTGASGSDLLSAGSTAINQNTAQHAGHQALSAAQSVRLKQQNLLVSEDFNTSYSVNLDPNGNWVWDGSDGAPSTGTLGCLLYIGNGVLSSDLSSEVDVVAGETIEVSCEIKTSSLTYTGINPISFGVEKYRKMKDTKGNVVYNDIGWVDVITLATPASNMPWTGFAGTYLVEAGVDQLRFRPSVGAGKTGGVVKFDAANFLKLDLISGDAVPATGLTTDAIVTNLYGKTGSGFTHNDAAVALANTHDSVSSSAAAIAALQAADHTGTIAGDDFSTNYADILSDPNWTGFYSGNGNYQITLGDAIWQVSDWGCTGFFVWHGTGTTSTTDYQLIQVVLDSAPGTASDQAFTTYQSYITLNGRMNAAETQYVSATIGSDATWNISYQNSGLTILRSGTLAKVPGAGATISFYLGDAPTAAPRRFRLQVGSVIVADFTESGTGSQLGSSNRQWGFQADTGGTWFTQAQPPAINQWLGLDQ